MAKKAETMLPPGRLWPNTPWGAAIEIEVMGATGEFATGKTLLGLSIAPGVHPDGHPFAGQPRTLYLDLEKSGATYAGTGCERIDVPAEMAETIGPNYTARQAAEWFNGLPAKLRPGQYDVVVVDPINDIEAGMVDLVKANPAAHGYTAGQFSNSVPLLMAAMKAHWKRLLMSFSNCCKCFYFTTHLRDQFKGGRPSGKREPRGKETLQELASLYLWLERLPDADGKVSDKPSAIVMKQRLADTRINADGELEVVNLMPPRLPVATVAEIRRYIAQPPDYGRLKAAERVTEKPVTEIEMQEAKLAVAQAQAEAANAQSGLLERQKELIAIRKAARATTPQSSDQTGKATRAKSEKRQADAAAEAAEPEMSSVDTAGDGGTVFGDQKQQAEYAVAAEALERRIASFRELLPASGIDPERIRAAMAAKGADRFTALSKSEQEGLLVALLKAAEKRKVESGGDDIPF